MSDLPTHGLPLMERVIAHIAAHGFAFRDPGPWPPEGGICPVPETVLATLTLPGGAPLPPTLRRWLAFDGAWLARSCDWFDAPRAPVWKADSIEDFARHQYGDMWGELFRGALPGGCLWLPLGSDSRRFLYLGTPDAAGELPVCVSDIDDMPFLAPMYPDFAVYMADLCGLLELEFDTCTGLHDHPVYGPLMAAHAAANFGGRRCWEM